MVRRGSHRGRTSFGKEGAGIVLGVFKAEREVLEACGRQTFL